ncbi:MAG: dienelactone hydrolase family protein, partial [Chloroflexota bacterium]
VKVPVLGLFGGADQSNPPAKIKQWEDKLKELGKTNEMITYPDAPHAFFNDTRPSYRADAAKDALKRTLDWFDEYLIGSEMATPAATQGS